jgi:hypothetical protein
MLRDAEIKTLLRRRTKTRVKATVEKRNRFPAKRAAMKGTATTLTRCSRYGLKTARRTPGTRRRYLKSLVLGTESVCQKCLHQIRVAGITHKAPTRARGVRMAEGRVKRPPLATRQPSASNVSTFNGRAAASGMNLVRLAKGPAPLRWREKE